MASEVVFGSLASGGCCCCCKMGLPNKAATLALALNVSIFETVEEEEDDEMIVVDVVGKVVGVVAAEFGNGCTCSLVMASTTGASNDDSFLQLCICTKRKDRAYSHARAYWFRDSAKYVR